MSRTRAACLVVAGATASVLYWPPAGAVVAAAAPAPPPSTQDFNPGTVGGTDEAYTRPQVPDIGDVAVTVDEGFQDYNNNTGGGQQPGQHLHQPAGRSPRRTSSTRTWCCGSTRTTWSRSPSPRQNPQVIEWKWRPEAVWSDGRPMGCKDMYLLWLAGDATVKDGDAQIFDSSAHRLRADLGHHLLARRKTVTTHVLRRPTPTTGACSRVAGQAGSQLLPAHILEQKTGIADITKIDPKADTPGAARGRHVLHHRLGRVRPGGGPVRRPVQDRELDPQRHHGAGAQRQVVGQPRRAGQDHASPRSPTRRPTCRSCSTRKCRSSSRRRSRPSPSRSAPRAASSTSSPRVGRPTSTSTSR